MNIFTNSATSLKVKLPLSIVIIVVITFTISTVFTLYSFTGVVQSVKDSHLEGIAQNIGENISTRIHQAGRDMVMVASFPGVLQAVEMPPAHKEDGSHMTKRMALTAFFQRLLLSYGYYNAFYIVDRSGQFILGTRPSAKDLTRGKESVHFKKAMQQSGFFVGATEYNTQLKRTLVPIFLELVYNGHSGALTSSLHIEKIANSALQSTAHENVSPHILAIQGDTATTIVGHSKINLLQGPWIKEMKKNPSGVLHIRVDEKTYTMGYYHIPQTDIYAISLAADSYMSTPANILRNTAIVTNILAVFVVMIFLFYITIPITRELSLLSRFAKAVTEGRDDVTIPTKRKDELGHLANSLETMVSKLKDMVLRSEAATKAKSDFLACMSHEIRTPMNGILGMTHLALQANPNEKQKEYLLRIDTAAKTLLGVINDILDFSKIEAQKLDINYTTFRISGVLSSMRDMLQEKCDSKGLSLDFTVDTAVPDIIQGDPLRFAQICINLCSNAIKFTPKGAVAMHISVEEQKGAELMLRVAISDTGIGIAPENIDKIFESFSQADGTTTRQYGGTGLGLTISKSLVQLLGGNIWVESVWHQGSTFTFTMQAKEGEEKHLENPGQIQNNTQELPPLNILLVEDNEINQEIALEVLKDMGCTVTLAVNGAEAVGSFELGSFDLILMDIQMPVMDGITAAKNIRASKHPRAKDIPIVAMTAHAMTGDKEKSLEAGMNAHITKPIDIKELYNALHTWGTAFTS